MTDDNSHAAQIQALREQLQEERAARRDAEMRAELRRLRDALDLRDAKAEMRAEVREAMASLQLLQVRAVIDQKMDQMRREIADVQRRAFEGQIEAMRLAVAQAQARAPVQVPLYAPPGAQYPRQEGKAHLHLLQEIPSTAELNGKRTENANRENRAGRGG